MTIKDMYQFKGIRNDAGPKFVPEEYFYEMVNVTQDNIAGFDKVLAPLIVDTVVTGKNIDGIFKYNYLNSSNKLEEKQISVCNGGIYEGFIDPVSIHSGMSIAKCQAVVYRDKLLIVNGKDYPKYYNGESVWEMGAPEAVITRAAGYLKGSYYYAVTFVTSGGEEYLGTVSNTIDIENRQVLLNLPIGYNGTLTRKIYRTAANGTQLKLLTTIADNTTLTYTDNALDSALGTNIISANNECPKPKFVTVSQSFKLVGIGDPKFPTQAFISEANVEVWDSAVFTDISNRGNDNTELVGMSDDYGLIIIGSKKQIYFLDTSDTTPTVTITRANIGILDGYSIVKMPSNSGFAGGVMFVASDYAIRVMNGNYADPVPTSLDNIKTENWAQQIRGSLSKALKSYSNIHAEYFDFKYHLVIDSKIYIFDTRILGWTGILEFRTKSHLCRPRVLANFDNKTLYLGSKGYIEKMYSDTQYFGEDLPARAKTPYWCVGEDVKLFKELHIYYRKEAEMNYTVNIYVGDDQNPAITEEINESSTCTFNSNFFNSLYFNADEPKEDYKNIYINEYGNWIQVEFEFPAADKPIAAFNSNFFNPLYYSTPDSVSDDQNPFGNISYFRGMKVIYA